jgi:transposase
MGRDQAVQCECTSMEIHAVVDTSGLPVRPALTTGEAHDNRLVLTLLSA